MRYIVFNILPVIIEIILVCIIFLVHFLVLHYSLITLVIIILYSLATFKITKWRLKFRKSLNESDNNVSNTILESLINYETVKFFEMKNSNSKNLMII